MAEVEKAILSRLSLATAGLASAGSIWAVLAPQDQAKPYIVFEVLDEITNNVMSKETTPTECFFTTRIYADLFSEIVSITDDVRASFDRFTGTAGGIVVQDVFYEGRSDNYDDRDREYERELTFRIWFEE
tara:strand:+ start:1872 stop:2261 length:390 start_codon:yes stop_codon:yes gene_type:complete